MNAEKNDIEPKTNIGILLDKEHHLGLFKKYLESYAQLDKQLAIDLITSMDETIALGFEIEDQRKKLEEENKKLQEENNHLIDENDYLHDTVEELYDDLNEYDEWDGE